MKLDHFSPPSCLVFMSFSPSRRPRYFARAATGFVSAIGANFGANFSANFRVSFRLGALTHDAWRFNFV
jgi:hypothetical protein